MATPLTFEIKHQLGKDEAKRRIGERFSTLIETTPGFSFAQGSGQWQGDVFPLAATGFGQTVSGRIEAFDAAIRVTVDVPDVLAPLARAAMSMMKAKTQLLLEGPRR